MISGRVVTLRINPSDCLAIVSQIKALGLYQPGMSFASAVSACFSHLLATNAQPIDGFDYNSIMSTFAATSHKVKLVITNNKKIAEQIGPVVYEPFQSVDPPPIENEEQLPVNENFLYAQSRLTELLAKKDIAGDNPSVIWSAYDEQEFNDCYKIIYPEG